MMMMRRTMQRLQPSSLRSLHLQPFPSPLRAAGMHSRDQAAMQKRALRLWFAGLVAVRTVQYSMLLFRWARWLAMDACMR